MTLIVASPKSTSFLGRVGRMLSRLSKVQAIRPRRRYVNIGEFSPHLQRDMGFLDGRVGPGRWCGADAHAARNLDAAR